MDLIIVIIILGLIFTGWILGMIAFVGKKIIDLFF